MRYLYCSFLLIFTACNAPSVDHKALDIIHASIEAHGGLDHWNEIKSIKFRKETTLYHVDGSIEKDLNEIHTIHQQDTLFGSIISVDLDSEKSYTLNFADGKGTKVDKTKTTDGTNAFLSSHFVVNQPFKLLDPGIELTYEGRDTLSSGKIVEVIKAYYGNPEDDIWWFYFDSETDMLCANLIYHSPTYAFVDNEVTEIIDGMPWNLKRTTYRTDSLRNIEYVRAKFVYEVLETSR